MLAIYKTTGRSSSSWVKWLASPWSIHAMTGTDSKGSGVVNWMLKFVLIKVQGLEICSAKYGNFRSKAIMTSSNGNIFRFTGPLCGEFTDQRWIPLTKGQWREALMFSLICALNKWLNKQSWGWWFETPSRSLWRHCNGDCRLVMTPYTYTIVAFYWHGLTLIPAWISNHMPSKVWGEIFIYSITSTV